MTDEQRKAIEVIKSECYVLPFLDGDRATLINSALDVAIEAMEQESVLDYIRAEIEDAAFDWQEIDGEHNSFRVVELTDALDIIDKYMKESED
jgi:hypothetical protein